MRCDNIADDYQLNAIISIHAPRVRCDDSFKQHRILSSISIHAPRVRCDFKIASRYTSFLYFNPRTSCEVRQEARQALVERSEISIHAPRVRCDDNTDYQSDSHHISIHAPRVRCDTPISIEVGFNGHFNPRTSCEVRQYKHWADIGISIFQSTHLV